MMVEEHPEVILWGTDQLDSVDWQFRAADTYWLAQLMAGAVRQRYPHLKVAVWKCSVDVNNRQQLWNFTKK